MKQSNILITLVLLVLFSGIGFVGGIKYQEKKSILTRGQFPNSMMGRGNNPSGNLAGADRRPKMMAGGQVIGEILSSDDKSVTVKLPDGSSKIILVTASTSINIATIATITDIKIGEKVSIFGATNADGSVTATNIQISPSATPTK